jgi:hypothetical protein
MSVATGTVDAPLASRHDPCPACGGELQSVPAFDGPAEMLLGLFYARDRYEELRALREVWCVDEECGWRGSARG